MFKRLWRSRVIQASLGNLLAGYLYLVRATSRIIIEPPDGYDRKAADAPAICALWHGQHFMIPVGKRPQDKYRVLISRHGDGELNAIAASRFGIGLIRGSGAQRPDQIRKRGGVAALRAMLDTLAEGVHVTVTADVPKVSRVAGEGIVLLAKHSGRPIYPLTVVSRRRIDFPSWDRASVGLPFSTCAVVIGAPIHVPPDADAEKIEMARRLVEASLDEVHARAFALLGSRDPGADRESVAKAREVKRRAAIEAIAAAQAKGA